MVTIKCCNLCHIEKAKIFRIQTSAAIISLPCISYFLIPYLLHIICHEVSVTVLTYYLIYYLM